MEFPLVDVVTVAGMCFLAGVVDARYLYLPAFMALIFPAFAIQASMVGMVASIFLGALSKFTKPKGLV